MNILLILTITLSNIILLVRSDHKDGWTYSDVTHSLYKVFPENATVYSSAVKFCEKLNSSLVVIDSSAEFIWLQDFVNSYIDFDKYNSKDNVVLTWVSFFYAIIYTYMCCHFLFS